MPTALSPPSERATTDAGADQGERVMAAGRMKAILQDAYGSADVLQLRDIDKPVVGDHDVLLRVHAAGIHPGDWHLMTGKPYAVRMVAGLRAPKIRVRGTDVAGQVEAVGVNVTRFTAGDEVFGTCKGGFAEFACAAEDKLAPQPSNQTHEEAAAVPTSGFTALQGLRAGRVQAGQKVLIVGAGGGVGTFAVQLAKAFGAEVTGVCSTMKMELVRSIGAVNVIDYTRDDFASGVERYDLILDTAGNRSLSHLRRALAPKGTLVLIGGEGGGQWVGSATVRSLRALLLSPFVSQKLRGVLAKPRQEDLQLLREMIEAGTVIPVIDRTYPLSEVPEAMQNVADGHARGKVVISVWKS